MVSAGGPPGPGLFCFPQTWAWLPNPVNLVLVILLTILLSLRSPTWEVAHPHLALLAPGLEFFPAGTGIYAAGCLGRNSTFPIGGCREPESGLWSGRCPWVSP
jgi:hypothetical protein